jgi:hypothetical protein
MAINTENPFTLRNSLTRARSYSTFFEKRDALIREWIYSLSPEEHKALEEMALKFIDALREKQQMRHAANNPDSINIRKVTLIGTETAMQLLVLIALRDDIDFRS